MINAPGPNRYSKERITAEMKDAKEKKKEWEIISGILFGIGIWPTIIGLFTLMAYLTKFDKDANIIFSLSFLIGGIALIGLGDLCFEQSEKMGRRVSKMEKNALRRVDIQI